MAAWLSRGDGVSSSVGEGIIANQKGRGKNKNVVNLVELNVEARMRNRRRLLRVTRSPFALLIPSVGGT